MLARDDDPRRGWMERTRSEPALEQARALDQRVEAQLVVGARDHVLVDRDESAHSVRACEQLLEPAHQLALVEERDHAARVGCDLARIDRERAAIRAVRAIGIVEPAIVDAGGRDRDLADVRRLAGLVVEVRLIRLRDERPVVDDRREPLQLIAHVGIARRLAEHAREPVARVLEVLELLLVQARDELREAQPLARITRGLELAA